MRIYEEMFIVRPDITDEELDPFVETLRGIITSAQGTIDKVDKMGVRRLAYKVDKKSEGFYVLMQFQAEPDLVKELERRLRVTDMVMKFMTVRIDEKLKTAAKLKKAKEARAARKPPAPVAPELPFANMMEPRPGAPAPGAPLPAAPLPAEPEAALPAEPEAVTPGVAPEGAPEPNVEPTPEPTPQEQV